MFTPSRFYLGNTYWVFTMWISRLQGSLAESFHWWNSTLWKKYSRSFHCSLKESRHWNSRPCSTYYFMHFHPVSKAGWCYWSYYNQITKILYRLRERCCGDTLQVLAEDSVKAHHRLNAEQDVVGEIKGVTYVL